MVLFVALAVVFAISIAALIGGIILLFKSFVEEMNFYHPNRIKDVEFYISKKSRGWLKRHDKQTKQLILNNLLEPKTTKELSRLVNVLQRTVIKHLKELDKEGYVERIGNNHRKGFIWALSQEKKTKT